MISKILNQLAAVVVNDVKSAVSGGGLNGISPLYVFGWFISIINTCVPYDK